MTSMLDHPDNHVDSGTRAEAVHREQIDTVFRQLPLILGVDAASGTLLVLLALTFGERVYLGTYVWIAVLLAYCSIFYLFARPQAANSSTSENIKPRERFLLAVVFCSGLIWGCTWLLAPISTEPLIVPPKGATIIWLCLMLANAIIFLSINRRLFLAFAMPAVALHISFSLYMGAQQDLQIAGSLSIIFLFAYFLAMRIGRDLNRTIRLRLHNTELDIQLRHDAKILRKREEELVVRIKREEALLREKQESDNKLAMAAREKLLLLDAVGEGIFGINSKGNITFVNAMALQLLRLQESDIIGEDAMDIICRNGTQTEKEADTRASINLCLLKGQSVQSVTGVFSTNGDSLLPVSFSCRPIIEERTLIGAVISFSDMTRQLEMESRLLQAQKMEAIGRITGGVAHDFNNMLTVIMGNLQFLKRRLVSDGRVGETEIIDNLVKAAKNGADLNKRLLSFSRDQALQSKEEDINEILTDMESFLRGIAGEDIELSLDVNKESNVVNIDRAQFENVIVSLCVNAKDAMPSGGKLAIASRLVTLNDSFANLPKSSGEGTYVEITVTDNGIGISEENQDKIFDPFFTTKAMGEGSGFGLSTAFGFLQQSGGNIAVQSKQGQWTKFFLHLPLAHQKPMSQDEGIAEGKNLKQFRGTILLVEDDTDVRDIAARMLLEAGFDVIAANDGNSGLERFNTNPNIDLVFSDIMMPGGMNGIDMAKKMLKEKPAIPILLATGYTKQILKERIDESDNITCISKPYDTDKLPEIISSMLVNG